MARSPMKKATIGSLFSWGALGDQKVRPLVTVSFKIFH